MKGWDSTHTSGCVQGGVRAGAWSSCCLLAVQWFLCASEVPEHRGKGEGAAKGKVSPCFLGKFNASGSSDGDMHPWEVFATTAGINLQGPRWTGSGWVLHFPLAQAGPTGIPAMSPACSSPAPAGSTPPALRSCFSHLNSFNIYSLYSLNTRIFDGYFSWSFFIILSSSPAIVYLQWSPLHVMSPLHLCLRYPGTPHCANKTSHLQTWKNEKKPPHFKARWWY